jgi:hypothetical protein
MNFYTAFGKGSRASPAKELTSEVESGALDAMTHWFLFSSSAEV